MCLVRSKYTALEARVSVNPFEIVRVIKWLSCQIMGVTSRDHEAFILIKAVLFCCVKSILLLIFDYLRIMPCDEMLKFEDSK